MILNSKSNGLGKHSHTWYRNFDCKKRLAKVMMDMEVSRVIKVPPRNRKLPRSANMAATEKHTKTTVVPSKAVTIIEGFTTLT